MCSLDLQSGDRQVESCNKRLTEELTQAKSTNVNLTKTLEDTQKQNKVHGDDILLYSVFCI